MYIEVNDENGRDKYLINIRYIVKVEGDRNDVFIKLRNGDILSVKEDFDTVKLRIIEEDTRDRNACYR